MAEHLFVRTTATLASLFMSVVLILGFSGCGNSPSTSSPKAEASPSIYTTSYPIFYFTQRITGSWGQVVCPVPENEDPIFWVPPISIIQKFQAADLIIINGADFAKWVSKVSLPRAKVLDTAKPFQEEFIVIKNALPHHHDSGETHSHTGLDGHTWLSPIHAMKQCATIRDALSKRWPERKSTFEANELSLKKDLLELDARLREVSLLLKGQTIVASHPAYNYIAKQYGWEIKNLDLDPKSVPDKKTFLYLNQLKKKAHSSILLWESTPSPQVQGEILKKSGFRSIEFNPCELLKKASREEGLDYIKVMSRNIQSLKQVATSKKS